MKRSVLFVISAFSLLVACKKERFIASPDAAIFISVDTIRFDTVFTSAGSVTSSFKIFNPNDGKLMLNSVELSGGNSSQFHINADGIPGPVINNIEIGANDSVYVFVTANINPNSSQAPFLISDSIRVKFNDSYALVQLTAYGQNANYLRSSLINTNTTWNNTLPYVILGGVQVAEGTTLTIEPGTRIHLHADAPFVVDGSLIAIGSKKDSIVFQGDRLDKDYKDLPASWPGIYFRETSRSNQLRNVLVKNAYQGIVAIRPSPSFPKVELNECVIDNIYDAGVYGINSSIRAINCLISNSGLNILLTNGGEYEFTHCTAASYGNIFIAHKKPVCVISNWDSTTQINSYDLTARMTNNIFWGENGNVEDELVISRKGTSAFSVLLENNLFKALNLPGNATLANNIVNDPPLFDSIADFSRYYDFRINKGRSPAINKGRNAGITIDLEGNPRDGLPDIGSYEKQ